MTPDILIYHISNTTKLYLYISGELESNLLLYSWWVTFFCGVSAFVNWEQFLLKLNLFVSTDMADLFFHTRWAERFSSPRSFLVPVGFRLVHFGLYLILLICPWQCQKPIFCTFDTKAVNLFLLSSHMELNYLSYTVHTIG